MIIKSHVIQVLRWRSIRRSWPISYRAHHQLIKRDISIKRFKKKTSWNHTSIEKSYNNSLFFLRRKREIAYTVDGGLSWRRTCSSTKSALLTDTCWVSLSWRGVRSDARRVMFSFPSRSCSKEPNWRLTGLLQWIVRVRRAGWRRSSRPATVTSPCCCETWGDSMKVCSS